MPLKPRELIIETRAKDSKISPARHVLPSGLAVLGLLTKLCWMEVRMCLGWLFCPPEQPGFWEGLLVDADVLCPCGPPSLGQAGSQGLGALWPLQAVPAAAAQHLLVLGVPLVLVLPWLTCRAADVPRKLSLLLRHQHFTSCWMGEFGSLLRAQLWEPKVLTSQSALSKDSTAWPCLRCSAWFFLL